MCAVGADALAGDERRGLSAHSVARDSCDSRRRGAANRYGCTRSIRLSPYSMKALDAESFDAGVQS